MQEKKYPNNVIFLKVKLNEAENKYKNIQDKLEEISQETNARAPECMALKAEVTARKRAYNEAEVRSLLAWNIENCMTKNSCVYPFLKLEEKQTIGVLSD